MKVLRAAGVLIALAAALAVSPVHADQAGLTLRLSLGWDGAASAGAWIPYQVSVRNDSASLDFKGRVVIRAQPPQGAGVSIPYGSSYQQPINLAPATQKQVTIYGAYLDPSSGVAGYAAELIDGRGEVVARSPIAGLSSGRLALALLSDSQQAAGQIKDTPLHAGPAGVVQLSPQTLPSTAVELGGLAAIVIDGFDSSTLSQAQGQALEQYVGLGGQLVVAGGAGWRRTLGQIPAGLVPLRPEASTTVSLDPVLDLQGGHTELTATGVVGSLATGARVVLADLAGNALLVELGYGAGRVVEVTFDPADQQVAGHLEEVRASWSAILDRVGGSVPATFSRQPAPGVVLAPGGPTGQVFLGRAGLDAALTQLLNDTPANALPPLGILGGLLVLYLLLAGPVNYALLRAWKRRELMWVTVPLTSILFTAGSYGAGIAVHGRDYFVNEIQVLRLTPNGGVDAAGYDAVFSPGRGDLAIQLAEASVASTYLPGSAASFAQSGDDSVVDDTSPLVNFRNIAIWTPRDLKTETATRASIGVEAHLKLAGGRVLGTVANRGRTVVRRVELMTTDGRIAVLAAVVGPGSTVSVNAALRTVVVASGGGGLSCSNGGCVQIAPTTSADREASVMTDAAGSMVSPTGQVQALTGIVDPVPGFLVNGARPTRTAIAAFLLPVTLESVDVLSANWSAPRVVAGNGLAADPISVIDYPLPPLPTGAKLVLAGTASAINQSSTTQQPTIEVYDWSTATWDAAGLLTHSFQLSAGQRGPDLVRLRVRGNLYLEGLSVTAR